MTICIGLTGGLASGKTTAAAMFAKLGAGLTDADDISRTLTAPGGEALPLLRQTLGVWAFDENGELLRTEVRTRIFADDELRQQLENILHPLIAREIKKQIAHGGNYPYLLLSIPLLLETGLFVADCRRIAVVDCATETQIARATKRDGMTAAQAQAIIAAQMPRMQRQQRADDIIDNDGDCNALQQAVSKCHSDYVGLAEQLKQSRQTAIVKNSLN